MKLMELYQDITEDWGFIDEALLDEDYPTSWDVEEFAKLTSFAARQRYCEQNLKKLKAGSGRIVYQIDDVKVLKLAKNKKGVAQCEVEIEWGTDGYYGGGNSILAQVFEYHPDALWVEMELARKVTKSKWKQIMGFSWDDYTAMVYNFWFADARNRKGGYGMSFDVDPEVEQAIWDSDTYAGEGFFGDITQYMGDTTAPAGDLARLSSYGIVKRDGHDVIVLIDYGLTQDVYDGYYS